MGFFLSENVEDAPRAEPSGARKPLRGPIRNRVSGLRYYNPETGRWVSRDPINEAGHKLIRGEEPKYGVDGDIFEVFRFEEEKALYAFISNNPVNSFDLLGLGENFGRYCNKSGGDERALVSGRWVPLPPGDCVGGLRNIGGSSSDCDGMTCGGGFYWVGAFQTGTCRTPGCDSPPYDDRRWTPDNPDSGARPPGGPGGRGSREGNWPPDYEYGPRPECACENPRPGAQHGH